MPNHNHFAFGKNWASYSSLVGEREVEEAEKGLLKLVERQKIFGASFIDIGCGSGLHSLAAARLGASRIVAIDYDPDSVNTTKSLLERFQVSISHRVERYDILNGDGVSRYGLFDVVYSWGVLHHTGDMWRAIENAAELVKPGGLFVFSLYRKTYMDFFWKQEKPLYSNAPESAQRWIRGLYVMAFRLGLLLRLQSFEEYVARYRSVRGMDFYHDVHDWLGGYPYETATSWQVARKLAELGFDLVTEITRPTSLGLLGAGCDEYVYARRRMSEAT
jgi:SAM-dependent methyltransferase